MDEFSFIFTVFFMLLGPIKIIPAFSGLMQDADKRFKRDVAIRGVALASALCVFVVLVGEILLGNYRIPLDAVRIAGGLVLLISALQGEGAEPVEGDELTKFRDRAGVRRAGQ